jgi:hypothetical protein
MPPFEPSMRRCLLELFDHSQTEDCKCGDSPREPDKPIYGKYVFAFPVNIVFTYFVMYKCVFAVFVRAVAQFISLATGNQPLHGWLWAINLREGNDLLILQLPLSNDHLLLDTAMEILLVAFP